MSATIHALNPSTVTVPPSDNTNIPAYLRDVAQRLETGQLKPMDNIIIVFVDAQGKVSCESAKTVRRDQVLGDLMLAQATLLYERS